MENTILFSGRQTHYQVGRPAYAPQLIEALYQIIGMTSSSVVADVGAGTGKFAAQLLERGTRVVCVEPNDDMRHGAEKALAQFTNTRFSAGDASHTQLPDNSVDFITTAQAFHWFDVAQFQQESRRILKPNGKAVLIWNLRDTSSPFNRDCAKIFEKWCPRFRGFGGGIQENDTRIAAYFNQAYNVLEFDNPLTLDMDKFIARCLSGSYSLQAGDTGYETYLDELKTLFHTYEQSGEIIMANKSVAYWGSV